MERAQSGLEEIRAYWVEQARRHGSSHAATWSDRHAIQLEIREILAHLRDGQRVLDCGCGNGYSDARYATERDIALTGIDYVPEMIAAATKTRDRLADDVRRRLKFRVGDVTDLEFEDGSFDVVICTRVIINLGSWEAQRRGLAECVRAVAPGGLFLLSEATVGGWSRINGLRAEWGLSDIPMPPFNLYLDEDAVADALADVATLEHISNFSSTYFLVTRFLKPLLAHAIGGGVDVADPESELNRLAASAPVVGDYGTQKLLVFRRR